MKSHTAFILLISLFLIAGIATASATASKVSVTSEPIFSNIYIGEYNTNMSVTNSGDYTTYITTQFKDGGSLANYTFISNTYAIKPHTSENITLTFIFAEIGRIDGEIQISAS
jgi:hypothetical protein